MFTPPLGVAYVAGAIRADGFEVQCIDGVGEAMDVRTKTARGCYQYGLPHQEVVNRIEPKTEIIGLSIGFSFEWPSCRELIDLIRSRFPDALLLGGGEHVTAVPGQSLEESALDIVILGEGEETAVEICQGCRIDRLEPAEVLGIAYQTADGEVILNDRRARKRDLDAIDPPAWDLLPITNYLDRGQGFGVNRGRSMPLLASRGCPYSCTFCSNPLMWTTRWAARDPDLVLDEIEEYQKTYQAQNFDFYDLTAIVKKSWIVAFCEKILERGLQFTWQLPSGTRSEAIDEEVADYLYRSGCRNLSYSPESGSNTVLERIKKRINTESVVQSIESCYRRGISIKANIMLGFPGETLSEVLETYQFITRMAIAGADDIAIWAFTPYPGSDLFDQIREEKGLVLDDAYYDSLRSYADASETVSYSEHISNRRLKALRWTGVTLFYLSSWLYRPGRPFRILWHLLTGKHETRSEMALAQMVRRKRLKSRLVCEGDNGEN